MAASKRTPPLKAPLKAALAGVARALATLEQRAMIIGGVAVIARGVARATRDVDATIAFDGDVEDLVTRLKDHDVVPRIADAAKFARERQVLLLRHAPSGVDVDISLAWLPFELEALALGDRMAVSGIDVTVSNGGV